HALARLEGALDAPPGAVGLFLSPWIHEGIAAGEARRHREGQPRVGNARDAVDLAVSHRLGEEPADTREHVRVRDDDAQIDVERGADARLQRELAEAERPDLEEALDEVAMRDGRAHAPSSAPSSWKIASAARAGSGAAVMGRPTTRKCAPARAAAPGVATR